MDKNTKWSCLCDVDGGVVRIYWFGEEIFVLSHRSFKELYESMKPAGEYLSHEPLNDEDYKKWEDAENF